MAITKPKIYNLAFGLLLLQRTTTDPDTDTSNEVVALNNVYEIALENAIADLDLDSMATDVTLALIESDPTDDWSYSYTYPATCWKFRRIRSTALKDNKTTRIPFRILTDTAVKAIYSNQVDAEAEIIPSDTLLANFTSSTALAVAAQLAILGAPLIVGKGSRTLREEIEKKFLLFKAEAQERDRLDSQQFDAPEVNSEWVEARTE